MPSSCINNEEEAELSNEEYEVARSDIQNEEETETFPATCNEGGDENDAKSIPESDIPNEEGPETSSVTREERDSNNKADAKRLAYAPRYDEYSRNSGNDNKIEINVSRADQEDSPKRPGAVRVEGMGADLESQQPDPLQATAPMEESNDLPRARPIEAEVVPENPNLGDAIDEAVENALRRREENMPRASEVRVERLNEGGNEVESDNDEQETSKFWDKRKIMIAGAGSLLVLLLIILLIVFLLNGNEDPPVDSTTGPIDAPDGGETDDQDDITPPWTIPPTIEGAFPSDFCREDSTILLPMVEEIENHTAPSSNFTNLDCSLQPGSNIRWYTFKPYKNEIVTAKIVAPTTYTRLSVLEGGCEDFPTCITSYSAWRTHSQTFPAASGKTYFILVNTNFNGSKYQLELEGVDLISNHECPGALDVTTASSLPGGYSAAQNNANAFPSFSDTACSVSERDRGLWYKITPTQDTIVTVRVSQQRFSARLSYFAVESSSDSCDSLICKDASTSSTAVRFLSFAAIAGMDYYVVVTGNGFSSVGDFQLKINAPTPPENSYYSGATDVTKSIPFRTTNSTADSVPGFSSLVCSILDTHRGLWYKITPDEDAIVNVVLKTQQFSGRLSYYTASSGSLKCEYATSSSTSSRYLQFHGKAGTTYYIFVSGYNFAAAGLFELTIDAPKPPVNSFCTGSANAFGGSSTTFFSQEDTSALAVPSFSSLACSIDETHRGLWYKISTPQDAIVRAVLSSQTFSAKMSLYSGSSCDDLTCRDKTTTSTSSRYLTFHAESSADYYILVSGYSFSYAGPFFLQIEAPVPPTNSYCEGATDINDAYIVSNTQGNACLTEEDCRQKAQEVGLNVGGAGFSFASSSYVDKGCYFYTDGAYSGHAYFGTGGTEEEMTTTDGGIIACHKRLWCGKSDFNFDSSNDCFSTYPTDWLGSSCSGNLCANPALSSEDISLTLTDASTWAVPSFSSVSCSIDKSHRGLWYKFTPTSNAIVTARLSGQTFSAKLSYYTGDCNGLMCKGVTGSHSTYARSLIFHGEPGTTYYIFASGYNFDNAGDFQMSFNAPNPPRNSYCAGAIDTGISADTSTFVATGDTRNTVPVFSSLPCKVGSDTRGAWYQVQPMTTASSLVVTVSDPDFPAKISLFRTSDTLSSSCNSVSCVSSTSASQRLRLLTHSITSSLYTYFVFVSGDSFSRVGTFTINITVT